MAVRLSTLDRGATIWPETARWVCFVFGEGTQFHGGIKHRTQSILPARSCILGDEGGTQRAGGFRYACTQLAHLLGPLVDLHEGLVVRTRLHRNRVDALSHHEVPDDIRFLSRARPAD